MILNLNQALVDTQTELLVSSESLVSVPNGLQYLRSLFHANLSVHNVTACRYTKDLYGETSEMNSNFIFALVKNIHEVFY